MKKVLLGSGAALLVLAAIGLTSQVSRSSIIVGPVALDASSVATTGTPVTAVKASTAYNGCWIQNDPAATTNLAVDAVGTASYATPLSTVSWIVPGGTWNCPQGSVLAVTVDAAENGHKFYGVKY